MRRSRAAASLLAAALARALAAQALPWIVPGVANTAGANGAYLSELTIVNLAGRIERYARWVF